MVPETYPIPYEYIDPNIRTLIKFLNALPGIRTQGCCGGHKNPTEIQKPEGTWFVGFWVYKRGRVATFPRLEKACKASGISLKQRDRTWYYFMDGKGQPQDSLALLEVAYQRESIDPSGQHR